MTRVLLGFAGAVTLLGAGACRRDDPTAKAIRATVSSAHPPASFQNARWKLLRQVHADRDYRSLLHFRDDPYRKDARVMGTMGKPAPVERPVCSAG